MIDINKAITVRYKVQNHNFEILVESSEKAIGFRHGKYTANDILVTDEIFTDVKRGLKASEHDMQKLFSTSEKSKMIERILKEGRKDENGSNIQELMEKIKQREQSEKKRYKEIYNIDYSDKKLYNLIIDTTGISPDEVINKIMDAIKK